MITIGTVDLSTRRRGYRYRTAIELLEEAGLSFAVRIVEGSDEVDLLAGVSGSILPRFFLGDPEAHDWGPSRLKVKQRRPELAALNPLAAGGFHRVGWE